MAKPVVLGFRSALSGSAGSDGEQISQPRTQVPTKLRETKFSPFRGGTHERPVAQIEHCSLELFDRASTNRGRRLVGRESRSAQRIRLEDLPRSLDGPQERRSDPGQRHLAESRAGEAKREVGQRVNELKARPKHAIEDAQDQNPCFVGRREARRRAPRHHASRHPAPHRRQASGAARDGRDRRRLQGDGILGRRRPRGRDRLLQLRVAELSAEPSGARHPGHAVHRRAGEQARARSPAAAHAHFAGADSHHGDSSRRRCAS